MDLATALIWLLRITLPVILFCIYFKLQDGSGDKEAEVSTAPTGITISREKMLRHRKAVLGAPPPEAVGSVKLLGPAQAPELFAAGGRGSRRERGAREERGERSRRNEERGDRGEKKERKERRDRGSEDDRERKERGAGTRRSEEVPPAPDSAAFAPAADPTEEIELQPMSEAEEKMHLESLLNYVAFNPTEQQRVFLPDEAAPPPPPAKLPPKAGEEGPPMVPVVMDSEATEAKANAEAQMVLNGAIKFRWRSPRRHSR
eukprot:TRINITY_DN9088_c0_g1_i11.p1 TRINITY_DN9088_c0_g1~~TRINITY_DN9088_c0_g1_i11.p1  ORF type:complete len:260 (+),score=63.47 TRINITY_DN9088_c0_g1_i11:224-1003(+)